MDLEDEYKEKIEKRIDVVLSSFKNALDDNHELLGKTSEELFKVWKPEVDETLTELIYELLLKSWLLGMRHLAEERIQDFADVELNFDYSLTFDEARAFAGNRIAMTKDQFEKLSADIKCYAFTVGRLSQLDMIEKVQRTYLGQLESSALNIDDFLKNVGTILGKDSGYQKYYELVFRTNIQKDYNAGKAMQMMEDPPLFLEFVGIDDERQSDICAARSGVVLPYTDPWWDDNWPPLHYNCRSTVREIFAEEANERGLLEKGYKPKSALKNVGESRPLKGFGVNPAKDNSFWTTTPSMANRIVEDLIQEEINSVVGQTVCKDFSVPKKGMFQVATSRGGVRYPENMANPKEVADNLEIAKVLAEEGGYYVELRSASDLTGNRQWDAWLNGMDKVEFKTPVGKTVRSLEHLILDGYNQAQSVAVNLRYGEQLDSLKKMINLHIESTKKKRVVKQLIVIHNSKMTVLSEADLSSGEKVGAKLDLLK